MEILTLLDGVKATGASEALNIVNILRAPETYISQIPAHIFGTTVPAVSATAPGLDDCTSGGTFTGVVATDYQVKIDAIADIAAAVHAGSGPDDITSGGTYTGPEDLVYVVEIDAEGTPDTFQWSKDGGLTWEATGVAITGSAQALDNGVTVTSVGTDNHTAGDTWTFTCTVDTFKWSSDGGSTFPITGVSITAAAQTLELGVIVTFGSATGHALDDLWDIACTLAFVGTVLIEATLATDAEVAAGTARWDTLLSKTAAALDEVAIAYTHIRANVTAYTSGAIWAKVLI